MSKYKDFLHLKPGQYIKSLLDIDIFGRSKNKYYLIISSRADGFYYIDNYGDKNYADCLYSWDIDNPLNYNPDDVKSAKRNLFGSLKDNIKIASNFSFNFWDEGTNMEQQYQPINLDNFATVLESNGAIKKESLRWDNYWLYKDYAFYWDNNGIRIYFGDFIDTLCSILHHRISKLLIMVEPLVGKLKPLPIEPEIDFIEYLKNNGFVGSNSFIEGKSIGIYIWYENYFQLTSNIRYAKTKANADFLIAKDKEIAEGLQKYEEVTK